MPKRGIPQNTAKYWQLSVGALKSTNKISIFTISMMYLVFSCCFLFDILTLIYDFRRCFRQNQHVSFFELFFTHGIFLTVVNIKLWVWKETLFPGNVIVTRFLTGVRWTCECRVNFILRSPLQSQFFNSYRFCGLVSAVNYIRTQKEIVSKQGSVKAGCGLTVDYKGIENNGTIVVTFSFAWKQYSLQSAFYVLKPFKILISLSSMKILFHVQFYKWRFFVCMSIQLV